MSETTMYLTQSRFYSPVFNGAIFDGPFRIYFSQHQEQEVLSLYFKLQEEMNHKFVQANEKFKKNGKHIFLMVYPNDETFNSTFVEAREEMFAQDNLGPDDVIGFRSPLAELDYGKVWEMLTEIIDSWEVPTSEWMSSRAELAGNLEIL